MKIIKIGALWCPGCLIVNKTLKKIKKEYDVEIIEYDYDGDEEEIIKWNVGSILPVNIICDDNMN